MSNPIEPKPCPECKGERVVLKNDGHDYPDAAPEMWYKECPTCHGTGAEPTHQLRDTTKEIEPTNTDAETQLRRDLIRARYGSNTSGVTVSLAKIIKLEEAARIYADTRAAEARIQENERWLSCIDEDDDPMCIYISLENFHDRIAQLAPPNYKEK